MASRGSSSGFSAYIDGLYREQGVELVDEGPVWSRAHGRRDRRRPTTAWLDDGVVVDKRFGASSEGVFAVGDVARFHDLIIDEQRRIEHWSHANYPGAEVGRILAGAKGGYDTVSSLFAELFGKDIPRLRRARRNRGSKARSRSAAPSFATAMTAGSSPCSRAGSRTTSRAAEGRDPRVEQATYAPAGQCSTVSSPIGKSFGFAVARRAPADEAAAAIRQSAWESVRP